MRDPTGSASTKQSWRAALSSTRCRMLALCALAVCIVFAAIAVSKGIAPVRVGSFLGNGVAYLASTLMLMCVELLYILARDRPDSPIGHLRSSGFFAAWLKAATTGLPVIVALLIFMPVFSLMKSAIPVFTDYTWDATFIAWDRAIHGQDAWRFLQPVFGHPLVTSVMSGFYHLWILLPYAGCLLLIRYCRQEAILFRFFTAYFLCWIVLGVIGAIWLASVGPCFAAPMLGIHTFDPQMAYLREANTQYPVMVLQVQDALIEWYQSGS
ncbi:MAG: hypothetical protein AB7U34_10990, partial [Novosphingobium sp.]